MGDGNSILAGIRDGTIAPQSAAAIAVVIATHCSHATAFELRTVMEMHT